MRLRRSPREIADRLRQELRNLALLAHPPRLALRDIPRPPLPGLPDPGECTGPLNDADLLGLAGQIRAHRFPILGLTVETGPEIAWRRDYVHGKETGTRYFRLLPFLDVERAGDHKIIWELNRHQHLVVLAQAFRLGGDAGNLQEIETELRSWFQANPFQRGMNWASALEVAFRALSWMWVYHLVGDQFAPAFRDEFLQWLYWHGRHLEVNLSFYFSPNTHLLGEAVALHALGVTMPQLSRAARWHELGGRVVREEMEHQVRGDGAHFEQSTYYHVYALDMFRFHAMLEPQDAAYRDKLDRMQEFLVAVQGPAGRIPLLGDDDGGRFIRFDRPGMPKLERRSQLFAEVGIAVLNAGEAHIVIDVGPFGPWGSGHSHSDTLSLTARAGDEDVLIDPGTYTYVGDAAERNWFRGSAAHNTIRIDGRDQAIPMDPFRWINQPQVKISTWSTDDAEDYLDAECSYAGFTHRRQFRFFKDKKLLLIQDEVTGPEGEHEIEQFWHLGSPEARARIKLSDDAEMIDGWASPVFGRKQRSLALRVALRGSLPERLQAAIYLGEMKKESS